MTPFGRSSQPLHANSPHDMTGSICDAPGEPARGSHRTVGRYVRGATRHAASPGSRVIGVPAEKPAPVSQESAGDARAGAPLAPTIGLRTVTGVVAKPTMSTRSTSRMRQPSIMSAVGWPTSSGPGSRPPTSPDTSSRPTRIWATHRLSRCPNCWNGWSAFACSTGSVARRTPGDAGQRRRPCVAGGRPAPDLSALVRRATPRRSAPTPR